MTLNHGECCITKVTTLNTAHVRRQTFPAPRPAATFSNQYFSRNIFTIAKELCTSSDRFHLEQTHTVPRSLTSLPLPNSWSRYTRVFRAWIQVVGGFSLDKKKNSFLQYVCQSWCVIPSGIQLGLMFTIGRRLFIIIILIKVQHGVHWIYITCSCAG